MSYREYDFAYVKHLCDDWLRKHDIDYAKRMDAYNNLSSASKWIELPPSKYTPEREKVLALKCLVESDGALNRIVHLSSEDCYILHKSFD